MIVHILVIYRTLCVLAVGAADFDLCFFRVLLELRATMSFYHERCLADLRRHIRRLLQCR